MNTKDILLESASGFMMPFEASEEEEVQVSLGFGEQTPSANACDVLLKIAGKDA